MNDELIMKFGTGKMAKKIPFSCLIKPESLCIKSRREKGQNGGISKGEI